MYPKRLHFILFRKEWTKDTSIVLYLPQSSQYYCRMEFFLGSSLQSSYHTYSVWYHICLDLHNNKRSLEHVLQTRVSKHSLDPVQKGINYTLGMSNFPLYMLSSCVETNTDDIFILWDFMKYWSGYFWIQLRILSISLCLSKINWQSDGSLSQTSSGGRWRKHLSWSGSFAKSITIEYLILFWKDEQIVLIKERQSVCCKVIFAQDDVDIGVKLFNAQLYDWIWRNKFWKGSPG